MRWSVALIAAASVLVSVTAFAEDTPYAVHPDPAALPPLPAPVAIVEERPVTSQGSEDTVYLRGGGMMRGTVEELLPGRHVTIALTTGEIRKVPWVEVARVVVANAPGAPGLTASVPPIQIERPVVASTVDAPAILPMSGPLARVHVASTKVVQLYRRPAGTQGWIHACHSPCDLDLPLGDDYRVSGSNMATSREFRLAGTAGDRVTITVSPTSTGGMVIGGVLAGVGAMSMYGGLVANAGSYDSKNPGGAAIGVGLVAAALGTVLLLASAHTGVSQSEASKRNDAYIREPAWLTPRVSMKRPATLQILSRRF